jgi:GNAT superfamily N-acetyltransferase
MGVAVRKATSDDVPVMAEMLSRAFQDDPVKVDLLPDPARRAAQGPRLFETFAGFHLPHGEVYVTDALEGAALWDPPGHWRVPARRIATSLPRAVAIFGRRLVRNLGVLRDIERAHPREPHYYLAVLGTDPQHQGRGIATALMAPVLEQADREGAGAYLESSKQSNLAFYARFGFVVTGEYVFRGGGATVWFMWRDPRA